ncbi:Eukaryotic translation initiation factor 2B, subunit 4 delta, 67kDa [Chytriomyces hyalinus]|nr:Eukaryotic translation initiation factor 2B, subunit 4 delta, 67kDa [Chytriomyces hyalinus]
MPNKTTNKENLSVDPSHTSQAESTTVTSAQSDKSAKTPRQKNPPKTHEQQMFSKQDEPAGSTSSANASAKKKVVEVKKFKDMTPEEQREFKERGEAEKLAKRLAKEASKGGAGSSSGAPTQQQPQTPLAKQSASHSSSQSISSTTPNHGSNLNVSSTPAPMLQSQANLRAPSQIRFDDVKHQKKAVKGRTLAQKPVPLLAHLTQFEKKSATGIRSNLVHPAVVSLGVQFSEFIISGGIARCLAMLSAFKSVIADFVTPPGASIQRGLTTYLGKQIDYLTTTRHMAETMKCAIRQLKSEINNVELEKSDEEVKEELLDWIDMFILERIRSADNAIVSHAMEKIRSGDVILTFSHSAVVEQLLLDAHSKGLEFKVIICDARPILEGRSLAGNLARAGIECTYVLVSSLGAVMSKVTKVFLGASALWSNGAVLSRTGTSIVAMMANDAHVPVIVLCESIKFSSLVQLDSYVWNEIGDPEELVNIHAKNPQSVRSSLLVPPSLSDASVKPAILKEWRDEPQLKLLNLNYDVTPANFITLVICENGCIPSTSVLSVIQNMRMEEDKQRKRI